MIVAFTNGCFDLLHVGHTRYLSAARSLGDVLVVAVNSDRSVRELKGQNRPFTREDERAEIVAALECVDYVTVFDELRASELVRMVHPHVYIKGGDYSEDVDSPRFPVEGHVVLGLGGTVRVVALQEGYSTSQLVQKIEQAGSCRPSDC